MIPRLSYLDLYGHPILVGVTALVAVAVLVLAVLLWRRGDR